MTLDLEDGDPTLADASESERRRAARRIASEGAARRKATVTSKSTGGRVSAAQRTENELSNRLNNTFERIAASLESRGDEELATVIREDKEPMGQGLVSLTRNIKPLRNPLLIILNLVEPILAFGRVARVLYIRAVERRVRIAEERQQQAVYEAEQTVTSNNSYTDTTMFDAGT